eukprot:TRINITY_DN1847_c0_g2_i2.p1 TRINITY_DN1847_c0_g2~~TRINITY_DN1847_c0_g2_i2.p1  ORF type:complete len:601 (+),score=89.57 TRINITY_DN1847_c0_g2_i2:3859-5661(+)
MDKNVNDVETATDTERLQAMMKFQKHVKPEDYVDYDLYGRGDLRVFSSLSSTTGKNTSNEKDTTGKKNVESGNAKFFRVNFVRKKAKKFVEMLSSKVNCFCTRSEGKTDEVEQPDVGSPVTNESRTNSGNQSEIKELCANDHKAQRLASELVGVSTASKKISAGSETTEISKSDEGWIPHRVKSKVGSAESTSVVQEGMVERTLAKLRSTGSFVFKEPNSLKSHEGGIQDANVKPDRKSRVQMREESSAALDSQSAPMQFVLPGQVTRLQSLFQADSPNESGKAEIRHDSSSNHTKAAKEISFGDEKNAILCSEDCTDDGPDAMTPNAESFGKGNEHNAPAMRFLPDDIKDSRIMISGEQFDAPDSIVKRAVSSSNNDKPIAFNSTPPMKLDDIRAEIMPPETEQDIGEVEELVYGKDLSSHLSGRVEKMRSLFECSIPETVPEKEAVAATSESALIGASLSNDSAVLDSSDVIHDEPKIQLRAKATGDCNVHEETDCKQTGGSATSQAQVNTCAEIKNENTADEQNMVHVATDSDDRKSREVFAVVLEQNTEVEKAAVELDEGSYRSLEVDTVESSETQDVSSELSQPMSHFVGSCCIM